MNNLLMFNICCWSVLCVAAHAGGLDDVDQHQDMRVDQMITYIANPSDSSANINQVHNATQKKRADSHVDVKPKRHSETWTSIHLHNYHTKTIKVQLAFVGTQSIKFQTRPGTWQEHENTWQYESKWRRIYRNEGVIIKIPAYIPSNDNTFLTGVLYAYTNAFLRVRTPDKKQRTELRNRTFVLEPQLCWADMEYYVHVEENEYTVQEMDR